MNQPNESKRLAPWSDQDRVALREFLTKHALLDNLEENKPKCEGDTIEKRALTGSEKEGAEKLINHIKELARDEQSAEEPGAFMP